MLCQLDSVLVSLLRGLKLCVGVCIANDILIKKGENLYKKCIACHGANGDKIAPGSKGNIKIGGLNKAYLIKQLQGYAAGKADNGGAKVIMYANTKNWKFTTSDIEAVSAYIAQLPKVK
ncbi:c-type cytochrome [Campylobacter coli]|nr:c-type cytochrome [Campylobacter coli]EFV1157117.1 c-type cytochrome [Campylobacter coli]